MWLLAICIAGSLGFAFSLTNENQCVELIVLGTVQDGGSPHIGCKKKCCAALWLKTNSQRKVVSLGLVDHINKKRFIIEATPDFTTQLAALNTVGNFDTDAIVDGIMLTHAHIGHYTGLMYLGKEALGAKQVKVYAMPRMTQFLSNNGPWSQLMSQENIKLEPLQNKTKTQLTAQLTIEPILVNHRDEYSETVGYIINGPLKSALFIPDINKWEKWDEDINAYISKVDYAFLDATFYDSAELNYRDIAQIPHPFVVESMDRFKDLKAGEKNKIHFIHFNHTNRLLDSTSLESKTVKALGFNIAQYGQRIVL
jgi:pyrroloquinoline quinone biosynthesis protein B